jgi:outer membrane receptor for ferrienterochelin and colicin
MRATLGGVVNAVTKTGSNNFRGSAAMYYTDNKWLGDIRRELRSVPQRRPPGHSEASR